MRFEFNKSFPFTITGWRDVPATGLEMGSYSDSEAPDAPEMCRTNGLGTLRVSTIRVAVRTGETDILGLRTNTVRDHVHAIVCLALLWLKYSTVIAHGQQPHPRIKELKCQKLTLSQYLQRVHSRTRYAILWICHSDRSIEDQGAHRSPSSQGTSH